jgi:hypothetical protein
MLKAVVQEGRIVPLEPLPEAWKEGTTLEINETENSAFDIDTWAKEMNELCADVTPDDEDGMRQAIAEHRREAKEQVRREMALSE